MKSLTILLPVYQGMPYLSQSIDSILSQHNVDFECLAIDDGSTDGSAECLAQIRDPRFKLIPNGNLRKGLFPRLNQLLALCDSEYVRVLCQDDQLEAFCAQAETSFLNAHPEVDFCMIKAEWITQSGRTQAKAELNDLPDVLPHWLAVQQFFYHGCLPGNLSTVCARTSAVRRAGGFDERFLYAGDYALWSSLAARTGMGVIHRHGVKVRVHSGQLSRSKASQVGFVSENARVRQSLLPYLPQGVEKKALRFESQRQNVLDWHQGLRCLLSGRFQSACRIWSRFGARGFFTACFYWAFTLNNRIRPQAPWVLTPPHSSR
jgi:glycosyltransferase involved in cell wall biosynthesis